MTRDEIKTLMSSSKSADEWRINANQIKEKHGGSYPEHWFEDIMQSGLCDQTLGDGASKITIKTGKDALL